MAKAGLRPCPPGYVAGRRTPTPSASGRCSSATATRVLSDLHGRLCLRRRGRRQYHTRARTNSFRRWRVVSSARRAEVSAREFAPWEFHPAIRARPYERFLLRSLDAGATFEEGEARAAWRRLVRESHPRPDESRAGTLPERGAVRIAENVGLSPSTAPEEISAGQRSPDAHANWNIEWVHRALRRRRQHCLAARGSLAATTLRARAQAEAQSPRS